MNTRTVRKYLATRKHAPTPEQQHKAEFDDLVRCASSGNHHALGAIADAFGPALLDQARLDPGPLDLEAEEVVEALFGFAPRRRLKRDWEVWDEP